MAKSGSYPTLEDNEYKFSTFDLTATVTTLLSSYNGLHLAGPFVFGIYNMDYRAHSSCDYRLECTAIAAAGGEQGGWGAGGLGGWGAEEP